MSQAIMLRSKVLLPVPVAPKIATCLRRVSGEILKIASSSWNQFSSLVPMGRCSRDMGLMINPKAFVTAVERCAYVLDVRFAVSPLFLGMLPDVVKVIHVGLDREIEAPCIVHPCLPHVARDTVLLGAKGRMTDIVKEECRLFVERLLNGCGSFAVAAGKMW